MTKSDAASKRMKILICSVNFAPEQTGIGKYSGEMAEWLAARGHEVRAVTAPPYYPEWKVAAKYRWPPYSREKWHGVDVRRAPLWVPESPHGTSRILHLLSFALTSAPLVLRQVFWRPNLVIAVAPALLCAPLALLAARCCGAQALLHIQDFEIDVAFRMSMLRGALPKRVILTMERFLLRRFDVVSTISGRMVELLLRKGVPSDRIRYFPNWVDIGHIKPMSSATQYRDLLGIAREAVVVLFSGSLGGKQGLAVIPEVARMLASRADIVFIVCGEGVRKPLLEKASRELPNLHLLPLQPFDMLGTLLSTADIHLLPQSLGAADLVLPSKLSGMLASGRPVIATCLPGTELDLVVSHCGLVVEPEHAAPLAEAIVRLADDPALRSDYGRRARAYAEANFERHAILERIFNEFGRPPLTREELSEA